MENTKTINKKSFGVLFLITILAIILIAGSFIGKFREEIFICGITVLFTSLAGILIIGKHFLINKKED